MSFQSARQGGVQTEPGGLNELRGQSSKFRESKATRIWKAEYQRGESCTQREIQKLQAHESLAEHQFVHVCEETSRAGEKLPATN